MPFQAETSNDFAGKGTYYPSLLNPVGHLGKTSFFMDSFADQDRGTKVGKAFRTHHRGNPMTVASLGTNDDRVARRPDRRTGLGEVLAALARVLEQRADPAVLRTTFEETLQRIVPVRSVQLRDSTYQWPRATATIETQLVQFDVTQGRAVAPAVLEAALDPRARLGDWETQQLEAAASLAALVLEVERTRVRTSVHATVSSRPKRDGATPLIGSTAAMQTLRSNIERVAGTDFIVLLEGESGVGKELVARQIHELSRRRNGPFVAVNCAALVETLLEAELFGIEDGAATGVKGRRGKFEHADGGTLFLDEVSDLSLSAQAKLLRAIQELAVERVGGHSTRRIDTRIVAATNRALHPMVERRLFRADLYYRLSGVDIRVPSLRERRADILELAHYFLGRHRATRALRLSLAATEALATYDWPGNVRELERLVERAVALAQTDILQLDDLPPTVRGDYALTLAPSLDRRDTLRGWASRYVRLALERANGNKRAACQMLDISYHTLQAYLRRPMASDEPHAATDAPQQDAAEDDDLDCRAVEA
jgi:DNA-binding NtrC family response regulator